MDGEISGPLANGSVIAATRSISSATAMAAAAGEGPRRALGAIRAWLSPYRGDTHRAITSQAGFEAFSTRSVSVKPILCRSGRIFCAGLVHLSLRRDNLAHQRYRAWSAGLAHASVLIQQSGLDRDAFYCSNSRISYRRRHCIGLFRPDGCRACHRRAALPRPAKQCLGHGYGRWCAQCQWASDNHDLCRQPGQVSDQERIAVCRAYADRGGRNPILRVPAADRGLCHRGLSR